jgi:hypothetical protein
MPAVSDARSRLDRATRHARDLATRPIGWREARRRGRAYLRVLDGQKAWPEPLGEMSFTKTRKPVKLLRTADLWWRRTRARVIKNRLTPGVPT